MQPFFIVGAQRSGTTMLRLILNRHPRLCVPHESVFLAEIDPGPYEPIGDNLPALLDLIGAHRFVLSGNLLPDPDAVIARSPRTFAEVFDAMMSVVAERAGKVRWGDKTPSYVTEIDRLNALFSDARFVHLIRDGRDVALSLRRVRWGTNNLVKAARDWARKVELGRKMGRMIPHRYTEIRYEDLVSDPVPVVQHVCAFLGEEFSPGMTAHHLTARDEVPETSLPFHESSVSPIDPSRAYEWRTNMTPAEAAVFDRAAGPTLEAFGYERFPNRTRVRTKVAELRYELLGG